MTTITGATANSGYHPLAGQLAATLVAIAVPHELHDQLWRLVNAERSGWRKVTAGAAWQRLKRRPGRAIRRT